MTAERKEKRKSLASSASLKKARTPTDYCFSFFSLPSDVHGKTLQFLTIPEVLIFSTTSKEAHIVEEKWGNWPDQIEKEWKVNVPRSKYLLKYSTIYYNLKGWNKNKALFKEIKGEEKYVKIGPALFQSKLSKNQKKYASLPECLEQATLVGNFSLVKWLIANEEGPKFDPNQSQCYWVTLRISNLPLLQWLVKEAPEERRLKIKHNEYILAATWDQLQIMKWIKNSVLNNTEITTVIHQTALKWAANGGSIAVVQWLIEGEDGPCLTPDPFIIGYACASGNKNLVEWLESPARGQKRLEGNPHDHFLLELASIRFNSLFNPSP